MEMMKVSAGNTGKVFAEKYGIFYQPSSVALSTSLGKLERQQFTRGDQSSTRAAPKSMETITLGATISFGDFRAPEHVLPGEQVETFIEGINSYHAFQMSIPHIMEEEVLLQNIAADLTKNSARLEYKGLPVVVEPIITRDDLVYNRKRGLVLVDPNLAPLGTAEILCMWDHFRDGSCNSKRFARNISRYFENLGLENGKSRIGLITHPNYVAAQSQKTFAEILTALGWKCECVSPAEVVQIANDISGYDLLWNHVRELPESIIKLAEAKGIPIIDRPGFRIAESQLWFALLQLQGLEPLFSRHGISAEALSKIIPKCSILRRAKDNVEVCDDVSSTGLCYSTADLDKVRQHLGGNPKNVYILKSFDTSGSKGVQVTHLTLQKLLEKLPGDGIPVTIQECIVNSKPGTKFELYAASDGTHLQPFALAAMTSNTGGVIVHGGSESYQALCKYAFQASK